jgi:hypothetical protein
MALQKKNINGRRFSLIVDKTMPKVGLEVAFFFELSPASSKCKAPVLRKALYYQKCVPVMA